MSDLNANLEINKMLDFLNEGRKTFDEMSKEELQDYVDAATKGLKECIFHDENSREETQREIDELNAKIKQM